MILPPHAATIRIEVIRQLLAVGTPKPEIAEMLGVTRQALYSTIERFDLDKPLEQISLKAIKAHPHLQLAVQPNMRAALVQARIIERLLGVA
jgi:predicted DNA-binding protein YlxM (UPF0122 family)